MSRHESKYVVEEGYEVEIIKEWYNPLLNRKEIDLIVTHLGKGTPSRNMVKEFIIKIFKVEPGRVIVKKIESEFGWCKTRVHVHIYDSPELVEKIEPTHIIRKHRKSTKESKE